jgi:hypothetical protein
MPFGTKEFMKLMNLAIWYSRFPVRFIQFHQVVKEELHSEALMDKRTYTIYPLPLDSGGIKICAVSNFINTGNVFGGRVIWVFFNMKRDQREKRYFYKICRFFFKFLK